MTLLKAYEVTLPGFDGGTDATDHLVLWVAAETAEEVERLVEESDATFCDEVPWSEDDITYRLPEDEAEFVARLQAASPALHR